MQSVRARVPLSFLMLAGILGLLFYSTCVAP
jgi:hypothetical protein